MKRLTSLTLALVLLCLCVPTMIAMPDSLASIGRGILKHPVGIALFDGIIYVSDDQLNTCFMFSSSDGRLIKSKGTFNLRLSSPADIEISQYGELFIADSNNSRIVVCSSTLDYIREIGGIKDKLFEKPVDVCFKNNILWVVDQKKRQVIKCDRFGNVLGSIGKPGVGKGEFSLPSAIAVTYDKVYVADAGQNLIKVLNYNGTELASFGAVGTQPGSLSLPTDIKHDDFGNIYIIDKNNHDLAIYPSMNQPPIYFGRFGIYERPIDWFHSDSVDTDFDKEMPGILNNPTCVEIDRNCVYITDTENARVLVESLKTVWQSPRVHNLPFQPQTQDTPTHLISPLMLDFGSVSSTDYKEVSIKTTNYREDLGFAFFENISTFTVTPSVFRGSDITLKIAPKRGSGPFSGRLVIKLGNDIYRIPMRGTFDKLPSFTFANDVPCLVTLTEGPIQSSFTLDPQNRFEGDVMLEVSQPKYKTGWVKPAKGVEEIALTTVQAELSPNKISLPQEKAFRVTFHPIGRLRPGFYSFQIDAVSAKSKEIYASTTCILKVESMAIPQKQGTVLFETFTAHWCNNCGFHREAQYRLAHEYSQRRILPISMNTLDENDLETTGMTQPENYDRFKYYGGTGVPLSILNGEVVTVSSTTDSPFAADRIKGRKYSGSSFEYWKLRAAFDAVQKSYTVPICVSGDYDGESGNATLWHQLPEDVDESQIVALFAIMQDNIFYYSENGEKEHHFVVRQFIKEENSPTYTHQLQKSSNFYSFNFRTKKMPENFEIIPNDSMLVCFLQNKETKQILSVTKYNLGSKVKPRAEVFAEKDTVFMLPGERVSSKFFISNFGSRILTADYTIEGDSGITVFPATTQTIILPGATNDCFFSIQAPSTFVSGSSGKLTITLKTSEGESLTKEILINSK